MIFSNPKRNELHASTLCLIQYNACLHVLQWLRGKTRGAHAVQRRPVPAHHFRVNNATAAAKRYRSRVSITSRPPLSAHPFFPPLSAS